MNQTKKHTTGKKLLALLLALIMSVSLLPMSVFAADLDTEAPIVEGQTQQDAALDESDGEEEIVDSQEPVVEDPAPVQEDTTEDVNTLAAEGDVAVQADAFTVDETTALTRSKVVDVTYRAVMLDCGRKYFSVANIEKLIDTIAQYGYNQLQLSFGNGGCRFLLDDMSLSFKGVTLTSDTVKTNITDGNDSFNGDKRYLTEADMDAIIAHANSKGIEIVPMLNMPGHATAIVYNTGYASGGNLNVNDATSRYYGYALLKKYVDYFEGKGCKYFSFGSDESGYTGTNMTAFLTGCANVIVGAGMTPRAFNDATNVATMPKSVQITYWHQESGSQSASALASKYEMINTHGRWYYVIKTAQNSEIGTKYWQGTVNQTATSVELPVMKAEKMDKKWVGLNEYFDGNPGYGSTVSGSKGTMFCIWCDASQDAYLKDSDVISENENYGALYQLEKLAEHYWPDDIKKTTAPVVTTESGDAVPTTMTANGTVTLKASESVTWTTSNANVIKLESVSVTRRASVTGTSVKAIAVGAGTATITAKNASGETASYTITVQDAAAATTQKVTLKVGESKTFTDIDSTVDAGDKITGNAQYIATAKVERVEAVADTTVSTTKATTLEDGASYIMRVYDTNYALTSNTGRTDWNTQTLAFETYTAAEDDNVWTLEKSGSGYKIKCAAGYLNLGTGNNTAYVANSGEVFTLTSTTTGWTVKNPSGEYINALGGIANMTAGGWTGDGTRFDFYKVTTATEASNTLTITGTGEGETSVTVGTVTYNITVTAPKTTETKALSHGSSFTLPTGATAEITSGSGVTIENGKVVAGNANATAVVTAVVKNAGGKVTARYVYTFKVSAVDLSNVTPLSVELWVTNRYAGGTHNGTTYPATEAGHIVSVSAEAAYGPDGVTLESLVPTTGADERSLPLLYWKGTRLSSSNKQTYTGTDMSGAGSDFQKIRYYEDSWQYYSNNTWTKVLSTDQIIAYYMQVYNTSPEIVTAFRDYGGIAGDGGGEFDANWIAGYCGVGTAVVYSDKSMSPNGDDGVWNNTLLCYYDSATGGHTPGLIKVFDTEDFQITKITITKGVHKDSTGATGADATKTWNRTTSSVLWDKTTNDAGDEWYDETVIWTAEGHTPGETITLDDSIWGDTWKTSGIGEAFLLLFYVEPVAKEDNLEVVYWDDSADKQINPNDIMISVKNGVTFINGIKQISAVNTGIFTLDDDATIENSVGVSRGFNKNITILEGVAANYRSGIYEYYKADISEDGKTLTLHYRLKPVNNKHQFVVDFGLTVEFTDLLKWFNVTDATAVKYLSVAKANKLTESTGSWGSIKINETTWNSMTYTLNKMLSAAATIPLYCMLKDGTQVETQIEVIPAANVYYEDSFAKFYGSDGAEQDSFQETTSGDEMGKWYWDGKSANDAPAQALEALGGKSNVYGYDPAYNTNSTTFSMGSAKKVTVDATKFAYDPTVKFTFKGTGFDVISLTDNNSGAIVVNVERKDTNTTGYEAYNKNFLVNNYYGYSYDKTTHEWTVDNSAENNALYQIPVMKVTGLPYGEYAVTITVGYGEFFDKTKDGKYSFWMDAIRVYDPMGKDYADYTQDQEGYPQYIKLRDALASGEATPNENLLFIDGADKAEVTLYKNYGPNNEVYLAGGQAISFKLTGDLDKIATIQVGAKKPDGSDAVMIVNNENVSIANSATEMYYTITRDNNNCVTITNTGADILSLTNLKVTFTSAGTVSLTKTSTQEQANAVAAVRALFTAPEPDPEPVVFAPEYFQATWNRGTVKVGQKATLTVKTSTDVETVTVNGQDIGNYRVRTERTGWGWNAKKVTYHVFTYTVTAAEAGALDVSVAAVNAEGVSSAAVTATLTVQAASQRPGIGGWLDNIFGRWF